MLRILAITALAVGTTVATGCAKKGARPASSETVTVIVDNQNFYDATVYLRWNSDRRRLGQVGGFNKKEFVTRWNGPELQVEVDLLAGNRHLGDRIPVSPGEVVEVELPPNLDRVRTRIGSFPTYKN